MTNNWNKRDRALFYYGIARKIKNAAISLKY